MATIIDKVRDVLAPDNRVARIKERLDAARAELSQARHAHATAALTAQEPDAPKAAAGILSAASRDLDRALQAVADLEAALHAAEGRKARELADQAASDERAFEQTNDAAQALSKALDAFVKAGDDFADAVLALQGAAPDAEIGLKYMKSFVALPLCVAFRMRRGGFKRPIMFSDAQAAWLQYLPSAEEILGKPRKVAA